MNWKIFNLRHLMALHVLLFVASWNVFSADHIPGKLKPFRVLVIIGDQWEDPASYMVGKANLDISGTAYPRVIEESDFHHIAIVLKSWGIPFDVVRLDQQLLDQYMFLDMYNKPRYGTIIWDVNQTDKLMPQDYSIVAEMVKEYGIGLIALSDHISQPEIQNVLGLEYTGIRENNAALKVNGKHFMTEGLSSPFLVDSGTNANMERQQVEVSDGAVTIVEQGSSPQVTVKEYPSGGYVVWIGNDYDYMFYFQSLRTLLRRAITWTIGYNLYKTWDNDILMIMDDPGGASSVWLKSWHYPQPSEEIIEKYLINPLLKHNAVLNINFTPGFVNDAKRRLEPTWNENFIDGYGTKQDFVSSKRGYYKGVKLGVFEVMYHGLTHMQPDLDSDPGWYGTPLDKEKAEGGWYKEFGDTRRNKEIYAAEQLWRMKTGKEWLTEQFGVTPLQFCAGGGGISISYFNNTTKLAGQAGFGWCGWRYGYLGKDMAFMGWNFLGTPESPSIVTAPPDGHDRGISSEPEKFATIFDRYPKGRFMSINEFIGYLHAGNSGNWSKEMEKLTIKLDYDPHYCKYFETHASTWNLEFSDWLAKEMGEFSSIIVDGKKVKTPVKKIDIPKGTGEHRIEVKF